MEGGPPCFPPGSTCPAVLGHRLAVRAVRVRGPNPVPPAVPGRSAPARFCDCTIAGPTTPAAPKLPPVWPRPLSLAATRGVSVDFSSSGYLDVSVPRVAPLPRMCSAGGSRGLLPAGFAHSETLGSQGMCPSPRIIAACRVLRRLPVPRHPPCALTIFSHKTFDGLGSHTRSRRSGGWPPSRLKMRSSQRKIFLLTITLCGSQGAAGASPQGRRLRPRASRGRQTARPAGTGPCRRVRISSFSLERR